MFVTSHGLVDFEPYDKRDASEEPAEHDHRANGQADAVDVPPGQDVKVDDRHDEEEEHDVEGQGQRHRRARVSRGDQKLVPVLLFVFGCVVRAPV